MNLHQFVTLQTEKRYLVSQMQLNLIEAANLPETKTYKKVPFKKSFLRQFDVAEDFKLPKIQKFELFEQQKKKKLFCKKQKPFVQKEEVDLQQMLKTKPWKKV